MRVIALVAVFGTAAAAAATDQLRCEQPTPPHLVAPHAVLKAAARVQAVTDAGAHAAGAAPALLGCSRKGWGGWAAGGAVSQGSSRGSLAARQPPEPKTTHRKLKKTCKETPRKP